MCVPRSSCLFGSHSHSAVDGVDYGSGYGETLVLAKERAAQIAFRRLLYESITGLLRGSLRPSVSELEMAGNPQTFIDMNAEVRPNLPLPLKNEPVAPT